MASWDDDDDAGWKAPVVTPAPVVAAAQWDGEDEEEGQGDSWDATPAAPAPVKKVVPGERTLTKAQLIKKKEEEEKAARAAREALAEKHKNDPEMAKMTKEQQKKAQEESDLSLAFDAFGGNGISAVPREFKNEQLDKDNVDMAGGKDVTTIHGELATLKIANPLDGVPLNDTADFRAFGDKVVNMASKSGNQKHMVAFLLAAIEKGTARMKLEEVNELKTKITAIVAVKQKNEKGPAKKAAASSKKGTLAAGKGNSASGSGSKYDDEDYYDEDFAVC